MAALLGNDVVSVQSTETDMELTVSTYQHVGNLPFMEDYLRVFDGSKSSSLRKPCTFLGVFDGHGGQEAADFASRHLFEHILNHPKCQSTCPEDVTESISESFVAVHDLMSFVKCKLNTCRLACDYQNLLSTCTIIIINLVWALHM